MTEGLIKAAGALDKNSGFLSHLLNIMIGPTKRAEADAKYTSIIDHARREGEKIEAAHQHEMKLFQQSLDDRATVNLTKIIEKAEGYSEGKIDPEAEKNEDWFHRFFDYAKYVSDESLQEIWAKVLAGELEKSGTVSLRTIYSLSNLSKKEAEVFLKFSGGVYYHMGGVIKFITYSEYSKDTLASLGLLNADWAILKEIGVIDGGEGWNRSKDIDYTLGEACFFIEIANTMLGVYTNDDTKRSVQYYFIKLTNVGKELYNICQPQANYMYLHKLAKFNETEHNCSTYIMEWDSERKFFIKGERLN